MVSIPDLWDQTVVLPWQVARWGVTKEVLTMAVPLGE